LRFILEAFKVDVHEQNIYGQTQFIELTPKDEEEAKKWQENRQIAYLGSLSHFFVSVINDQIDKEGFVVYVPLEANILGKPDISGKVTDTPILVEPGSLPHERILSFPKHLKIDYTKSRAQDYYKSGDKQISWIALDSSIVVDMSGKALNPRAIRQSGYWAWKRIGDLLPKDYELGSSPFASSGHTPALDSLSEMIQSKTLDQLESELIVSVLDELEFKNSLNDVVIAQLHRDIIDIMSAEDAEKWRNLKTNKQKASFLRGFWLFRDMSFGTPKNERLEEHYDRIKFARTFYSTSKPGGYDDRGHAYIKYGEPDAKQIDVMPLHKQMDGGGNFRMAQGRSIETWSYQRSGRQVTYNFVDKIWGFSLVYSINDLLPAYLDTSEREIILNDILRTRVDLDVGFASLYSQASAGMTLNEFESSFNRVLSDQTFEHTQLPVTTSDEFSDVYELDFSFKPAIFENNSNEHTLALTYGLRQDDLRSPKSDANGQSELKFLSVVRNAGLVDIALSEQAIPFASAKFDEQGELVHQLQIPISENYFFVLADIANASGNQRGFADYTIRKPDFTDRQLHLSSVIFAKDIAAIGSAAQSDSSVLIRNDLAIKINPFSELRATDPHYLYFEIYGLQMDITGRTSYDVEYTVEPIKKGGLLRLAGKLNPFKKGRGKISVSNSQSGDKSRDFVFTRLDFSELSKGEHNLTVRIKDKVANETREKKSLFILR